MKFSEFWLREWANPDISSAALIEQITMAGLKVNNVELVAGQFTGVIIGKIVECVIHPKTNRLFVNKVNIGNDQLLRIVCNAPNCRVGLMVGVATIGAMLPGEFKVKATKLHGILSEGKLCSFNELGIFGNYDSIIELPNDAPIGQDIREYLKLNDNMIEISITPNRSDCLSVIGIARDVAVLNRIPLKPLDTKIVPIAINDLISVCISEPYACPQYAGRIIKGINTNASTPLWMQEKLRRCGLQSINSIIDITNFILLELGQPIRIFDLSKIVGSIVIRYTNQNEILALPDNDSITLSSNTLVIADSNKILAIAGILEGSASIVDSNTSDIVLECAFFQPTIILKTARHYGLHTDSSQRYERGVDPELQLCAVERATALIVEICGGQPGPVTNVISTTHPIRSVNIVLRRQKLDRLIGWYISDQDVCDILTSLGCKIRHADKYWHVLVPSWRFDISVEEDLIEEIARIYGYDAMPNVPIRADLAVSHCYESTLPLSRAKMLLIDRGYQEVITYSFINPKSQALIYPKKSPLMLINPLAYDRSAMRLSLWTGLLDTLVYNQHRQHRRIRLFESGLCFVPDNSASLGVRQDLMLSGVISGACFDEHWAQKCRTVDFYDIKGDLEAILELTGKLDDVKFKTQYHDALHPGQSAAIYFKNEIVGFIGAIHPALEEVLKLNGVTLVFELIWEKISECKLPKADNIFRFPSTRRDIAVVVAENIAAADIIEECKKVGLSQLIGIKLFDVYQGEGIAKGFKSLAISLILQDANHTLKEEEINMAVSKCLAVLKQKFQASLRY